MASKKAAKKTTPTAPIKFPARGSAEKGKGSAPTKAATKAKAVGKAQPAPKGKKVAASEEPSAGKPKSSAVGKAKSVVKPLSAPKTPAKALPKTKAKPAVMAKGTPEATSKAPVKPAPPANVSRAKNRTRPEALTKASKTKREPARELSIAKAPKPARGAKPQAEPALKLVSKAKPEPTKAKPEPTKAKPEPANKAKPKAPAKEEYSPPVAAEAKPSRAKKAPKSKPEPEGERDARDASESSSIASASPGGLTIGDSAPSFVLQDESSTVVSSETLRGSPYVLYFYPKDDTPGCTLQACGFRDLQPRFSAKGVRILGVSPDSPDTHARFKKKYGLTFPLLSDPEKTLAKAYGVWVKKTNYGREYMGVERSTFYVDKNGTIEQVWRGVRVPGHVDAVLDAV